MSESIADRLNEDLKEAMRNQNKVRRRTLRSLRSAFKNKTLGQHEGGDDSTLSEQEQLTVLRKEAKQRKEAIEQYEEAGRDDLVQKEQDELEVLQEYMPAELSDEELDETLQDIIDEVEADSMADMGAVMSSAMDRLRGRVDGSRVQDRVQALLGE